MNKMAMQILKGEYRFDCQYRLVCDHAFSAAIEN